MQSDTWLPLTEYALRSGVSISTLRRKIKSNTIDFKMEEGRYLIRADELEDQSAQNVGFASSDAPISRPMELSVDLPPPLAKKGPPPPKPQIFVESDYLASLGEIQNELAQVKEEGSLKWRALEARVAGLAKKLEMYSEQMAEVKMLVKIFEEKLDERS